MKDKPGRNDPCPCGSGKKFKKCCDKKMISGRFMASKISGATAGSTTSKLSSFFQNNISSIPSLGESGRTFTVQKGAPSKKTKTSENQVPEKPVSETPSEDGPPEKPKVTKKRANPEKESTQLVEPKGPEEEAPEENDEAHS